MVQVSRKTNRICQGGTQNRSNMALAEAVEYMKAGKLGEVKLARSIIYGGRGSIGAKGNYEAPKMSIIISSWALLFLHHLPEKTFITIGIGIGTQAMVS